MIEILKTCYPFAVEAIAMVVECLGIYWIAKHLTD